MSFSLYPFTDLRYENRVLCLRKSEQFFRRVLYILSSTGGSILFCLNLPSGNNGGKISPIEIENTTAGGGAAQK